MCHCLLTCKVSARQSASNFMGVLLHVTHYFNLAFKILLIVDILITMCLSMAYFGFMLFDTLCFLDLSIFYFRFGKFQAIICPSFSLPFPPVMQMLIGLMLSRMSLKLSSCLKKKFFFSYTDWVEQAKWTACVFQIANQFLCTIYSWFPSTVFLNFSILFFSSIGWGSLDFLTLKILTCFFHSCEFIENL